MALSPYLPPLIGRGNQTASGSAVPIESSARFGSLAPLPDAGRGWGEEATLLVEGCVDGDLDVVAERVRGGAALLRRCRRSRESRLIEARHLAMDLEAHGGDLHLA